MPETAKAVIVAYKMDYVMDEKSGCQELRTTVVKYLKWSKNTRNIFSELRKATKEYSDTAFLCDADKSADHKGYDGTYLSTAERFGPGWRVEKYPLRHKHDFTGLPHGDLALLSNSSTSKAKNKSGSNDTASGECNCTMALNEKLNGVELSFSDKPGQDVLSLLNSSPFRWHKKRKIWYAVQTEQTMSLANKLCKQEENECIQVQRSASSMVNPMNLLFGNRVVH